MIALFSLAANNFLLFHIAAEGITIVIGVAVFFHFLHSRTECPDSFLMLIGYACLLTACIDFLHVLIYFGMGVPISDSANKATQLWLAGRYVLAVSFLAAPFFFGRVYSEWLFRIVFTVLGMITLYAIFFWHGLPACLTPEHSLTSFKIYNESIIIAIFALAMIPFYLNRDRLNHNYYKGIQITLSIFILTEICFSLYINVYSVINILGHMFKVFAYVFVFFSLILNDANSSVCKYEGLRAFLLREGKPFAKL